MADPAAVLEGLNPIRRPDPTAMELAADMLAALSVGLAVVLVLVSLALLLTRRAAQSDPALMAADARPRRYRLPAYIRLLGEPLPPEEAEALYRPCAPQDEERRAREARARLEAARRAA